MSSAPERQRDFATVVSGIPRSGTSLVMQMLGAGGLPLLCDDARAPDEDNPRGYFEFEPVKASARDVSWFPRARGRAVKVIHALLQHLPDEGALRIVWVRRDLDQVLASQRRMVERTGGAGAARQADDALLSKVFADQLPAARSWAASRPRTSLLEIEHAALLRDPAAVAARIDAFLGGGLDREAMAACVDPRLHRSRGSS